MANVYTSYVLRGLPVVLCNDQVIFNLCTPQDGQKLLPHLNNPIRRSGAKYSYQRTIFNGPQRYEVFQPATNDGVPPLFIADVPTTTDGNAALRHLNRAVL